MKYLRQFVIILGVSFLGEILRVILPLPVPEMCIRDRSHGGRALNFLGGVKAYRRISNSECRSDAYRESDYTR